MKTRIKFTAVLLLAAALAIPTIQGCKKYPEGPSISLHSREERVANTWKVENYKINGTDYTSGTSDYQETYSKDGQYSYSSGIFSGSSTWAFTNDDEQILIAATATQDARTLVILKLKEKEFWYYYMDGSDKHEYHLLQK
ncbi:MAG: hypothetical protein ABIQ40_12810 [Bacteroidia bacterium]